MTFNLNGIEVPVNVYNGYLNNCINKVFKILPIYEDCSLNNDYEDYYVYLENLITVFVGSETLFEDNHYLEYLNILSLLRGLQSDKKLTHSKVKSLVFHCTNSIDKMKFLKEEIDDE